MPIPLQCLWPADEHLETDQVLAAILFLYDVSRKGSEFLCHIRFRNTLPDPPVDCKLVEIPPDLNAFTKYTPTDLERDYEYEISANLLKTPLIDFVDLEVFKPKMNEILDGEDEALLIPYEVLERKRKQAAETRAAQEAASEEATSSPKPVMSMDSMSRRPEVTWLRRTEYISSEFGKTAKRSLAESENATAAHTRQNIKLETLDDLVECIESGFEPYPLDELIHPTNPNLRAVESIPILPAVDLPQLGGITSLTQCIFDVDPGASHGLGEVPLETSGDQTAVLRAMSNPKDPSDAFVWYYMRPADAQALGQDSFVYVRDYDLQRNDKTGRSYVLMVDGQECHYVPVTSQFHLRKRRLKASDAPRQPHMLNVTRKAVE